MAIPFHMRIQVRQFLESVATMSEQMDSIVENIRVGKKGAVTLTPQQYLLFLADARRVEYLMLGIAVSGLGISLQMPDKNIPAKDFRLALDMAISNQLEELDNEKPNIILTDDNSRNGNGL